MAPNIGDYVDHVNTNSDVYIAANDIDYLLLDCPGFWKNGGDQEFLTSTNPVIGVATCETFKEAYRVGMDSVNHYWKQMKSTYIQPPRERQTRQLEYREFWLDVKPVIFAAPPELPRSTESFRKLLPEQQLKSILISFYEQLQPIVAPDWQPWRTIFPTLPADEMLTILERIPKSSGEQLVEVKQRLYIIVGLETAYSEETHDDVQRFLRFLARNIFWDKPGKVLLLCQSPFDAEGILDMNVFGKYTVVSYGDRRGPSSDPDVSDYDTLPELGDDRGDRKYDV
ncbi:phospholipid:diacylglycerol acyltransferase [Hypoxylon texense]